MNRKQTFWAPSPSDDDSHDLEWIRCRLADEWYATDGDRAIVPVTITGRRSESPSERSGLLVQFGGADLILDLHEAGIEQGDEFAVVNPRSGRPYIDEAAELPDGD